MDYWEQVKAAAALPAVTKTRLLPASPNPFNPRTVFAFELAQADRATIDL